MLNRFCRLVLVSLLVLAVCCSCEGDSSPATARLPPTTSESLPVSATTVMTTTAATTTTAEYHAVLPEAMARSLSEPGVFGIGIRTYTFADSTRLDHQVTVSVLYPANTDSNLVVEDAAPELSSGPYPVVMGSKNMANLIGVHLASHGFVVIGAEGQSTWSRHPDGRMVDYPVDLMVALDGLESLESQDPISGLADTRRTGVIDYSFGSWTALMLAGGRVNPSYYEATCVAPPTAWTESWFDYVCGSPEGWREMTAHAVEAGVAATDGLWQPIGDDRINAVMPMAPEGYDLLGPDGIASISIPVLYVAAGDDAMNPYDLAAVPLYEATNPASASMITLTDIGHSMIFDPDAQIQFKRFSLAFFGYHLAGTAEYGPALTEEFVENQAPYLEPHASYQTLTWGTDK